MPAKPLYLLVALLSATASCLAAELDFYRDVYPFLKTNCISCHNKTTTKADLNMETPELMKKGGETGPGLVPGKGADSLVVQAALHQSDLEMPPKNNKSGAVDLSTTELGILKAWIDQGAKSSVQEERQVVWQPLAPGVHPIYTVAMTQDGRYAACGRSNQIFVYDLATRELVTQLVDNTQKTGTAHRALVQSLAFSPDGTRLASGSFREVKIWRLESRNATAGKANAPVVPPAIDEKLAKAIAGAGKAAILTHGWSADGKVVATGDADGAVRIWNGATGKPVAELRGTVAASRQKAALDWTIAAATLEQSFQKSEVTRIEAQNKALDELLKKANETIIAMKKALPEKQKALEPAHAAKVTAQKSLEEVAALIAKAADGKAAPALEQQQRAAEDKLASASMVETSAQAAVASVENNINDAEADLKRITDSKTRNNHDLASANAAIEGAKKTQDKAATDLAAVALSLTKSSVKPLAVAFSPDGGKVGAVFSDGSLNVWAVASGAPTEQVRGQATTAASLVAGADGTFTATLADGSTLSSGSAPHWVLERVLGPGKGRPAFADRVNAVRFSPDGKTLAAGGGEPSRSGDISLFDVATGKLVKSWVERHDDAVLCLDFSPDGRLLASGAADKIARVTEIATGKQVNVFEGHTHHVTGVAFRSDGRVLATAGADGVVITWDMLMGERKKKIEGWTKEVTSAQFIGATNQIVTSAGDNLIRIVNDEGTEVRAIAKLPDFMQAAASTANGGTIIGGGEDSVLRVWDGTNAKEVAVFGAK